MRWLIQTLNPLSLVIMNGKMTAGAVLEVVLSIVRRLLTCSHALGSRLSPSPEYPFAKYQSFSRVGNHNFWPLPAVLLSPTFFIDTRSTVLLHIDYSKDTAPMRYLSPGLAPGIRVMPGPLRRMTFGNLKAFLVRQPA